MVSRLNLGLSNTSTCYQSYQNWQNILQETLRAFVRSVWDKPIISSGGAGRLNLSGPLPWKDSSFTTEAKRAEEKKHTIQGKGRKGDKCRKDWPIFFFCPLWCTWDTDMRSHATSLQLQKKHATLMLVVSCGHIKSGFVWFSVHHFQTINQVKTRGYF